MRILLTRPEDQARQTAEKLGMLGHSSVVAPLTQIHYRASATIDPSAFAAIAATSGRAIDALTRQAAFSDLLKLPLYCVGNKTAARARDTGFLTVHSADGNVDALVQMLTGALPKDSGRILYAAGKDRTGDLETRLREAGLPVELLVLYEARQSGGFPKSAVEKIRHGQIDAALVYSRRGAEALRTAFEQGGLDECVQKIAFFVISKAAAQPIIAWNARSITWPDQPNEAALLDLLKEAC